MHSEHSSRQYDMDLEAIRSKVFAMGGLVESQFREAMECFRSGDEKRAATVMANDESVNRLEIALDDACSHLIVKRQPAAIDLRMVMATVKVITDLERIGDESMKIARVATTISQRAFPSLNHYETVRSIAGQAGLMLHDALDAFARLDGPRARELLIRDELVDHEFRSILRNAITFMMEDPRTISGALDMLWVAKAIERIGDHAKNIAEYVVYVVEGKDIRHQKVAGGAEDKQT
jgi:phosphate transport system protein